MVLGIAVIFSSRSLSDNPLFFYLCGILVGVFASFMVLVYYVSKLLPKVSGFLIFITQRVACTKDWSFKASLFFDLNLEGTFLIFSYVVHR